MSWLSDEDDDGDYADYDESSARVRPNRKGSRPRTKQRPQHADALSGQVFSVDRGRYGVWLDGDGRKVVATRARELGRGSVVTGDRVDLVGDLSGDEGTLARIVRIHPRDTVLRRSADDTDTVERVIVANADQMLVVVAAANPEPRPRLVDRYLAAAFDAGITPILMITKTDLADPRPFLETFAGLDLETWTSGGMQPPVEALTARLDGHTTVAVGHSGVGKSTLVNALVPEANRAVGRVNDVTGRGRHTSSSTVSYRLGSGWIVDTPGIRSFGLGHVHADSILASFTDLAAIATQCPRGCTHLPDAPDCAIAEAVAAGELGERGPARLESLQRLLLAIRERPLAERAPERG